jgi:ubiquinol-cytochrome c reductase cytochrome b subunit
VPKRVTEQPSLEDRMRDVKKVYDEVTVVLPAPPEQAASLLSKCTFFRRRPNPEGIRKVAKRFAKTLKTSLD